MTNGQQQNTERNALERIFRPTELLRAIIQFVLLVSVFYFGCLFCVSAFFIGYWLNSELWQEINEHVLSRTLTNMKPLGELLDYWIYFLGYFFALVIGHISIAPTMDMVWRCDRSLDKTEVWQPEMVGFLERLLYTGCFTAAFVEDFKAVLIIPAWLVFKVAGNWRARFTSERVGARFINNNFLIGTLLCLIYAGIGASFAYFFYENKKNTSFAIFTFGLMLIISSLLTVASCWYLSTFLRKTRLDNWDRLLQELRESQFVTMTQVRQVLGEPHFVEEIGRGYRLIWHYEINRKEHQVRFEGSVCN